MARVRDWLGWILAALGLAAFSAVPAQAAEGDVSRVAPGATEVSVSRDGSVVGFISDAALVPNDRNGLPDVYVWVGGDVRPITVPGEGQGPDEPSRGVEVSRDGSTVAFFSGATNLVDGDTNGREDVFVADIASGAIQRVNLNQLGIQADVGFLLADRPSLSEDGSLLAFADSARLTDDAPIGDDSLVYLRDLGAGATSYVAEGSSPSLSGDGKTLAYRFGDQVWAVADGGTELVSANGSGEPGDGVSRQPDVDDDGSLIAFASTASDLGPGSENRGEDVFLRRRSGDPRTELVSLDDRSQPGTGNFAFPALDDDGDYVAFRAEEDVNGCLAETSVEVREVGREGTFRAARGLDNQLPNGPSGFAFGGGPSVSADGTVVGYPSFASNLVDGDDDNGPDGFLTELGPLEDPNVFISQGPPRVGETAGEMEFTYAVCQRAGRQLPFDFGFRTADGTATRDQDFVAGEGNLRFEGTVTEVVASVQVLDDDIDEPWETVYLDGNRETGAYVPARERGVIVDDEPDPENGLVSFEREGQILAVEPIGEAEPKVIAEGTEPAISRDGQRLAFIRHTEGSPDELVVAGADGSGAQSVLVAGGVGEGFGLGRPAWSPDGTRLAVTDFADSVADIAVVTDFETDEAETVLDDASQLGRTLSYSPDGTKLAFEQEGQVTTLDLNSGSLDVVASGFDPSYGPQGDLVYTRGEGMWILPDGGEEQGFEPADGGREAGFERPAFSPDGQALVYVVDEAGRYIETALIANGDETQLTPDGSNDLNPAWAPAVVAPLPTVSIGDPSATEGSPLSFGIDLSAPAATDVTVTATTLAGTAGAPDFTERSDAVTIPAGQTHADFAVQTTADALNENDETVSVTLSAPSGAVIADGTGVGTIIDNDPLPMVSVGDASATEGDAVAVPITLSPVSGRAVTVRLTTAGGTASGDDYIAQSNVLVTIPPGQTQVTANVPTTEDAVDEPDETFGVTISDAVNATLATTTATGTIVDDDDATPPAATVRTPPAVEEGGTLAFPVKLSHAAATDVTVRLSTGAGSATAGSDYTTRSNAEVVIPAGETEGSFDVATRTDALVEADETVTAAIDNASGATVGSPSSAIGTIRDVPPPRVSVRTPAAVDEGQTLQYPVRLDRAAASDVTVRLSTGTGSATANSDYTPRSNAEITIPAGQTEAFFEVATKTDGLVEGDETVTAAINGATGASAGSPTSATGTIRDVPPPRVSIRTAAVDEGQTLRFPVKLDRAAASDVTVRLSTGTGSATANSDYTPRFNAQITIPAGQTEAFFEVATIDDPLVEGDETVTASINGATGASAGSPTSAIGTIRSTDLPPPRVSVGTPVAADEGSSVRFPLMLDRAVGTDVKVRVSTSDGSATANDDYTPRISSELTIPAGQTEIAAEVAALDDDLTETDETVKLSIVGGTNVSAGSPSSATGTIRDAAVINLRRGGLLGGKLLSGTIKVKLPNGGGFIDLGAAAGLPVGTQVDATDGVIELSSAVQAKAKFASASARKVQRARFRDGIFTIRQGKRSALVTLVLSGPELRSCSRASTAATPKVRRLWGDGKGRFRTRGKFAAGTVRGTKWLTEDRCGSTRVKVTRGRVAVQDLVRKKTRVVRAGRSLTVRARG